MKKDIWFWCVCLENLILDMWIRSLAINTRQLSELIFWRRKCSSKIGSSLYRLVIILSFLLNWQKLVSLLYVGACVPKFDVLDLAFSVGFYVFVLELLIWSLLRFKSFDIGFFFSCLNKKCLVPWSNLGNAFKISYPIFNFAYRHCIFLMRLYHPIIICFSVKKKEKRKRKKKCEWSFRKWRVNYLWLFLFFSPLIKLKFIQILYFKIVIDFNYDYSLWVIFLPSIWGEGGIQFLVLHFYFEKTIYKLNLSQFFFLIILNLLYVYHMILTRLYSFFKWCFVVNAKHADPKIICWCHPLVIRILYTVMV